MKVPEERPGDPEDVRTAIRLLRALRNWDQKQLAAAMRVDKSRVSLWERGVAPLKEGDVRRLAEAAGLPPPLFPSLVRVARLYRPFFSPTAGTAPDAETFEEAFEAAARIGASIGATVQLAATELFLSWEAELDAAEENNRHTIPPDELWQRLQDVPPRHWAVVIEEGEEYQTRDLARRLCEESAQAKDPERALAAARAALAGVDKVVDEEEEETRKAAHHLREAVERGQAPPELARVLGERLR